MVHIDKMFANHTIFCNKAHPKNLDFRTKIFSEVQVKIPFYDILPFIQKSPKAFCKSVLPTRHLFCLSLKLEKYERVTSKLMKLFFVSNRTFHSIISEKEFHRYLNWILKLNEKNFNFVTLDVKRGF